ncbi:peptidylprolyl isomerase [soil metagenome]
MKIISIVSAVVALFVSVPTLARAGGDPVVQIKTTMGNITVELYADKAPKTVANFLQYVASKQYDGTIFHRVIPGFMIQGGGFTKDMVEKPTELPIPLEVSAGLKNDVGTIAMARTPDPNSATDQFFINVANNNNLDSGYAVFGKVTSGMDVVKKIEQVPTTMSGGMENVPSTPVIITSVKLQSK